MGLIPAKSLTKVLATFECRLLICSSGFVDANFSPVDPGTLTWAHGSDLAAVVVSAVLRKFYIGEERPDWRGLCRASLVEDGPAGCGGHLFRGG